MKSHGSGVPIVGIGGSAGALDPLKEFFSQVPPTAALLLSWSSTWTRPMVGWSELLARHAKLKVAAAQDRSAVQANCVYTIPLNNFLSVRNGTLRLRAARAANTFGACPVRAANADGARRPSFAARKSRRVGETFKGHADRCHQFLSRRKDL